VTGQYLVAYDVDEDSDTAHKFILYPKGENGRQQKVAGEPFETPPYMAPPQSGKI
jgi:hypothetical protein